MKRLNWNTIHDMIMIESNIFIHKCIFEGLQVTINELLTFNLNREVNVRSVKKPIVKNQITSIKCNQSLIFRAIYLYNKILDIFLRTFCL